MRSVSCLLAIVLAAFLLCACGAKDEPRASVESVVQENWPQFSDAEYDETAGTLRLTQESTMTYASAQKFGGEVYKDDLSLESYLTHMKCLENVGMLSTTPVEFNGQQIVPIQFLKTLLPDPASLGPRTVGKTNIGCIITGVKDGKEKTIYIYNVCDHQECYKELGCQAVAYTTGVPAMIGAAMVLSGQWSKKGVYTTDEFDPDPYMQMLNEYGLPWVVEENPETVA